MLYVSSDGLAQKTAKVKRGFTYTYYTHTPAAASKRPTVLLVHGWPDEAREWFGLAKNVLIPRGYGVIIPDCLGYAGTDKPRDAKQYLLQHMVPDIVDLLDAEGLDKVAVIGHDWGSGLAQRIYLYAPQRVLALGMVCVAYFGPKKSATNLKQLNDLFEQVFGYRCFEYQNFFASDQSDRLTEANLESMFDLLQTAEWPKAVRDIFSKPDGIADWYKAQTEGRRTAVQWHPNVSQQDQRYFIERFRRDGFNGPYNWYRAQTFHESADGEANVAVKDGVVRVPTLYVGYDDDLICRKELIFTSQKQGLLPNLTNVSLKGGHWGMVQDPEPFGKAVVQWLDDAVCAKSDPSKL